MPNITKNRLRDCLNSMAKNFIDAQIKNADADSTVGWGQFLDKSRENKQTGPYGTCAGLIVLSLADRRNTETAKKALKLLNMYWKKQESDIKYYKHFSQALRTSSLLLALRLSQTIESHPSFFGEVETKIFQSLIPQKGWGNYWFSIDSRDEVENDFCTSITLLSFSLLHSEDESLNARLIEIANNLESNLYLPKVISNSEEATIIAAILSIKKTVKKAEVKKRMIDVALKSEVDFDERSPYFFDIQYTEDDINKFAIDYYFLPVTIMRAIAGFQEGASSDLRLFSERVLDDLVQNIEKNNGVFRAPNTADKRIMTYEQAWAAILIKTSLVASSIVHSINNSNLLNKLIAGMLKFKYSIRRLRPDKLYWDILFTIPLVIATVLNTFSFFSNFAKCIFAVLTIISSLIGVPAIQRLWKRSIR